MTEAPRLQPDGRLALTGGLCLTLQRTFAEDWHPDGDRPARSHARLAFAYGPRGVGYAIPILPQEHVWIGLEPPTPPTRFEITLRSPGGDTVLTRVCPPDFAIKGMPVGRDYRPFAAGDVVTLRIRDLRATEAVDLPLLACPVDQVFDLGLRAGIAPLDRRRGFSGVRLP